LAYLKDPIYYLSAKKYLSKVALRTTLQMLLLKTYKTSRKYADKTHVTV